MNTKLRDYIETLFAGAPQTLRTVELKEEMLQNLNDKYNDLLAEGKNEEAAYNIAVASIGDISALIGERNDDPSSAAKRSSKSALLTAIAVMLYILCPVPCILFGEIGNGILGVTLLFVFIAVATGILIYNNSTKERFASDGSMMEDFKQWQNAKSSSSRICASITGALWLLITAAYLLVSFTTGAWHVTWIFFLIGAALSSVVKGIFELIAAERDQK